MTQQYFWGLNFNYPFIWIEKLENQNLFFWNSELKFISKAHQCQKAVLCISVYLLFSPNYQELNSFCQTYASTLEPYLIPSSPWLVPHHHGDRLKRPEQVSQSMELIIPSESEESNAMKNSWKSWKVNKR